MKNTYRSTTFILTALFLITVCGHAQQLAYWQEAPGPDGSSSRAVTVTAAGTVVAATYIGVYRSSNQGDHWSRSNAGLSEQLKYLTSHPEGNVVGVSERGRIHLSTDDGRTWDTAVIDREASYILTLAIAPSGVMYAGGLSGFVGFSAGVYRSTDNGRTWQHLGLDGFNITALLINTDGTIIVGADGQGDIALPSIQRSTDNGATWTQVTKDQIFALDREVVDFVIDSSGNYLAARPSSLWRSIDKGASWDSLASPFRYPGTYLTSMVVASDAAILAGTHAGPYRSTDNGSSWQRKPEDASDPSGTHVDDIALGSEGYTYAATDAGMYRSMDNGSTWQEKNVGIPSRITALATGGSSGVLALTPSGAKISNDGGATWATKLFGSDHANTVVVTPNGNFFIGTESGGIYRSTNGGTTWTRKQIEYPIHALGTNANGGLFMGTSTIGISRSTDNGDTWTSYPTTFNGYQIRNFAFEGQQNGYVATNSGVYKTTDNGENWQGTTMLGMIVSVAVDPEGVVYAVENLNGVYRSTDRGGTWILMGGGAQEYTSLVACPDSSVLYSTRGGGIHQTTDHGITWHEANTGLASLYISTLAIGSGWNIYAGTDSSSVFRWIGPKPLSVDNTRESSVLSMQCFPNPVANRTTVRFMLPTSSPITMVITNSLGQEITRRDLGRLPTGTHTVEWNAADVAPGVYLCTIRSGEQQVVAAVVRR